ncbi:MAG TPA: response regulator transcription factor [Pseudobdellovibrionaceae bacterium]
MTSSMKLKDYKILFLHGKTQLLTDIYHPLKAHSASLTDLTIFEGLDHQNFDLLIVDYSISDMTGILLYKKISELTNYGLVPAIFIADTKSYDHRLNAFEIGAADFINRPFESHDLVKKCLLHIKNRRRIAEDESIHIGNLILFPRSQTVTINGEPAPLTQLEYKILYCLVSNPRQVVSRSEIYAKVWGPGHSRSGRLDTQLYNLKKKISKFTGKIKSVNKVGLRILIAESTFSQEQKKQAPQLSTPQPHP